MGQARIDYPPAPSFEASGEEVTEMVQRLKDSGWSTDSEFKSHGTVLQKNNVVVVLGPQNASVPTRDIQLFRRVPRRDHREGRQQTEKVDLGAE